MAPSRPLSLFPNLNDTPMELPDIGSSEPPQSLPALVFNLAAMSFDQLLATMSNIDTNSHTMKSCAAAFTMVSNLSCRL
ncbi:hypothetical protein ACSBR1_023902 [Camellia fascicularis]